MAGSVTTLYFASGQASSLLGQLAFQTSRTIKSHDPDAVHDLRVAIRRFGQALIVFENCFPANGAKKIRRSLKRIMAVAGDVRNYDVAMDLLSKWDLRQAATLQSGFRAHRKEAEQILTDVLESWIERNTSAKWRSRLEAGSVANGETFSNDTIDHTAARTLRRMASDFFSRGEKASREKASLRKLHDFRIAAKRFRYTLEVFAPLYGPKLSSLLEQMKSVQTLLGDINDCATVREMLSRDEGSKLITAALKRRQRRKTKEFRQVWGAEFSCQENARRWIEYLSHFAGRRPPAKARAGRASAPQAVA